MSSKKNNLSGGLLWEGDFAHLVFSKSAEAVLQQSFELDNNIQGEVFVIKDNYSVAPIYELSQTEGWQQRKAFWENTIASENTDEQYISAMQDDKLTVKNIITQLQQNPNLHLWIWMGQNEQDVCGYYWLISQLKEWEGRMYILYLNNLPFINEKGGLYYPTYLKEILPRELLKAKRLARKISAAEIELDTEEWKKISNEDAAVRTLEGGKKIKSQSDNFYDEKIVQAIGRETFKISRLITQLSAKIKLDKPNLFWLWRIKHLIESNVLVEKGDWSKFKDVTVKVNNGELFQEAAEIQ